MPLGGVVRGAAKLYICMGRDSEHKKKKKRKNIE